MTITDYPGAVHVMESRVGCLSYSPAGKEGFDVFLVRKPVEDDILDGMLLGRTWTMERHEDGLSLWRRPVVNLAGLKMELKAAVMHLMLTADRHVDNQAPLWVKQLVEAHDKA